MAGVACLALLGKCVGSAPATDGGSISTNPRATSWQYVQSSVLNCRAEPTVSATSVERLTRNEFVGVVKTEGGWSLLDRDTNCWAKAQYLDDRRQAEPEPQRVRSLASKPRREARSAYYANCSAARAAGAAPVYRNDPGYSRKLDRDGDGVGCE